MSKHIVNEKEILNFLVKKIIKQQLIAAILITPAPIIGGVISKNIGWR